MYYDMSNKSWHILYSKLLHEMGQTFLDIQYVVKLPYVLLKFTALKKTNEFISDLEIWSNSYLHILHFYYIALPSIVHTLIYLRNKLLTLG